MVARTCFKVPLYLNFLSCYKYPNPNSNKQISLEYLDTKTLFFHHLLTSVIVQVICAFRIVTDQTSVESLRRQKVSFHIRGGNFFWALTTDLLLAYQVTQSFICAVAAVGTTDKILSRMPMDCAHKMCSCLLKKTLWDDEHVTANFISISLFS
jgi:hypothetical protein